MLINYVYSGKRVGIFADILKRHQRYAYQYGIELVASEEPIVNADLYHYHRPNKCIKFKSNSVLTQHFDIDDPYQKINQDDYLQKIMSCKKIICLNKRDYTRFNVLGFDSTLIEHGVDTGLNWKKTKYCSELVNIAVVARRYPDGRKGEQYLVKLAKKLDRQRFGFIFFGSGWFSIVLKLRLLGFRVKYYDNEPYEKLPEIYQNINMLYIGSVYEAGPASLQEAVQSGTYLLAHPVGAVPDYFDLDNSGRILSFDLYRDAESIEHLYTLIMLNQSPGFLKKTISWEENFIKHMYLYCGLINGKV